MSEGGGGWSSLVDAAADVQQEDMPAVMENVGMVGAAHGSDGDRFSAEADDKMAQQQGGIQPGPGGVIMEGLAGQVKRARVWNDDERAEHKLACLGKRKLTYREKLELIRRHESDDPEVHRSQAQLAEMFGKSRSAISKILRPASIEKVKSSAAAGLDTEMKRYLAPDFPELEKRLYQRIEAMFRPANGVIKGPISMNMNMSAVMANAENIAKDLDLDTFKATPSWYARFIKRFGLGKTVEEHAAAMQQTSQQIQMMHMPQPLMQQFPAPPPQSKVGVIIKVGFMNADGTHKDNHRRLEMTYDLDEGAVPINGFDSTMMFLRQIFHEDLAGSEPRMTYKGSEGEDVTVNCDKELSAAIHHFHGFHGGVVKFSVTTALSDDL
jgi:hypothetical protein